MKKYLLLFAGILIVVPSLFAKPKTVKYKNGDVYVGEWDKKAPNGQGVMTYANGDKYDGFWVDGFQSGEGTFWYASGDNYVGQWLAGQRSGQGILTYSNGSKYEGEWLEGKQSGKGKYISTKDSYEGEWKNGQKDGEGTYIHYGTKGKIIFSGMWYEDVLKKGRVVDGEYSFEGECNKLYSPIKGKLTCKNQNNRFYFEGTFKGTHEHLSQVVVDTGSGFFPHEGGYFNGNVVNGKLSKGVYSQGHFSNYDYLILDNCIMDGEWKDGFYNGSFLITSRKGNFLFKGESKDGSINGKLYSLRLNAGNVRFFEGSITDNNFIQGTGYVVPTDENTTDLPFHFINETCSSVFKDAVQNINSNILFDIDQEAFFQGAVEYFQEEKSNFLRENFDLVSVSFKRGINNIINVSYSNSYLGDGCIPGSTGVSLSSMAASVGNICKQIRLLYKSKENNDKSVMYSSKLNGNGFYKDFHLSDVSKDYALIKGDGVALKVAAFFVSDGRIYFAIIGSSDIANLQINGPIDDITRATVAAVAKQCCYYAKYFPYHVQGNTIYIEVGRNKTEVLEYDIERGTLRWDKYGIVLDKTSKKQVTDYLVSINYLSYK